MSPRRRLLAAGVVVVVLALVATVLAVRGRGPGGPGEAEGVRQDRPGPVLLVPGYGGGTAALERLATSLRAAGREAEIVPAVGGGTGDLTAQADRLRAAVDARLAAGAPSVDVIGYSAGGVVVRLWAVRLGGAAHARRVVTLGSPHHGTDVAGLAVELAPGECPPACRQLAPGSDLLAGLPDTVPGPVWTSVWTDRDQVVTPPDSARLRGAVNVVLQSVCPDARTEHGTLPTDPLAVGVVKAALAPDPPREPPSRDDCTALRRAGTAAAP